MSTHEFLKDYLAEHKIQEKAFSSKLNMRELTTIASAIEYGLKNPIKADYELFATIKREYPKLNLLETIQKAIESGQIKPTKASRLVHSEELEKAFQIESGKRLRAIRESKGVSPMDMAKLLGTGKNNYFAMETGRTHISAYRLLLITKKLGVSYQVIIDGSNADQTNTGMEEVVEAHKNQIKKLEKEIASLKENEVLYEKIIANKGLKKTK